MDQLLLSPIPLDKLAGLFRDIVRTEIDAKHQSDLQEKLLSPSEVCQMFQPAISRVTLNSWTKLGYMQEHRIGGRVYYKYSDVIESVKTIRRYKRPATTNPQ